MSWFILFPTASRYLYVLDCVYAAIFVTPCKAGFVPLLLPHRGKPTTAV